MTYKLLCMLSIALLLTGCGNSASNGGGSGSVIPESKPDFVMELGPPARYDGQIYDRALYQSYVIRNTGLRVNTNVTLVRIHIQFLFRGTVDSESDLDVFPSLIVDDDYDFTIAKVFPDTTFNASDWTIRTSIDPSDVFSEGSESNNTRVDPLMHYPSDPGVPDDGLGHHDLYAINANMSDTPIFYGSSTARFKVVCYGPLVAINGIVKIRIQHISGNAVQSTAETWAMNTYYDMQYGGLQINYPVPYAVPDGDFLRIEVDIDHVYTEFNEGNNVIDVPFVYTPMPNV